MDTVTHALLGVLAVQAAAPRRRLGDCERIGLGATAAAFPDVDFAGFLVDPLVFIADWHQGITHSLLMLPFWAAGIGALFAWLRHRHEALAEAAAVAAIALASHTAGDFFTAYGVQLLAPWQSGRVNAPLVFVIDPVFTLIILGSLVASMRGTLASARRRRLAAGGVLLACFYLAGLAGLKQRAAAGAEAWADANDIKAEIVTALPQPFSPFNWMLVVGTEESVYRAAVNLAGHRPLVPDLAPVRPLHATAAAYVPPTQAHWEAWRRMGALSDVGDLAAELWRRAEFAPYRRFAVLPALLRIDSDGTRTCVWFTDLRYDLPELPATFRYGFCREGGQEPWRLNRLRYLSANARVPL